MASPREREREEDEDEHYEDVLSEEPLAAEDDTTTALENLSKLKISGKGTSKDDKKRKKNKEKEKKRIKGKKEV
jgi:hypothetical protein